MDVTVKNKSPRESFPPNTFLVHSCEKTGEMLNRIPIPSLAPGAHFQFRIHLTAPDQPKNCTQLWRFSTSQLFKAGVFFKEKISLLVVTRLSHNRVKKQKPEEEKTAPEKMKT